jgi:hypothetical protein
MTSLRPKLPIQKRLFSQCTVIVFCFLVVLNQALMLKLGRGENQAADVDVEIGMGGKVGRNAGENVVFADWLEAREVVGQF